MYWLLGTPKNVNELRVLKSAVAATNRQQVPIAIIDDEDFTYLDILQRHNFLLKQFRDIEDVRTIHTYPIVLCDIKGVGKHFQSKFEGAHLIGEIRKHYPAKVIIAYTGHQFDASYNRYFAMSDFLLKKDIDSDEWIESLDAAIQTASDPIIRWKRLRNYLLEKDIPLTHLMKLEDDYVTKMSKHEDKFPSGKLLIGLPDDVKDILVDFTKTMLVKAIAG